MQSMNCTCDFPDVTNCHLAEYAVYRYHHSRWYPWTKRHPPLRPHTHTHILFVDAIRDGLWCNWQLTPAGQTSRISSTSRGESPRYESRGIWLKPYRAECESLRCGMRVPTVRNASPRCGNLFFPESTFSADCLTVSVHPRLQSHAFTSACTLKIM